MSTKKLKVEANGYYISTKKSENLHDSSFVEMEEEKQGRS